MPHPQGILHMNESTTQHLKSLFETLNDQQKEAVLHTGAPQLIIAGAGSGKTRVILVKIVYFVEQLGIHPRHILAVTFTNKAADEMAQRLIPYGIDATVGTFHAVALRILRSHGSYIGIDKNAVIYDEQDQQSVVKQCLQELKDSVTVSASAASLVEWISTQKDALRTPDQLEGTTAPDDYVKVYKLYNEKLARQQALDFGDIMVRATALLRDFSDLKRYYQQKYTHILVDEFQDTNTAQAVFLQLLAENAQELCVVGDPDQSIYGWRGANIHNIIRFEDYFPGTKIFKLEKNYRSTENILEASNALIAMNAARHDKRLFTDQKGGQHITAFRLQSDRDEAHKVADIIEDLSRARVPFNEMAVFYRVHTLSRLIEETFLQRGIPYSVIGGLPFYQRKEIKDLIAYLRVLVNPSDVVSWRRIINTPTRGIGDRTFEKMLEFHYEHEIDMLEVIKRHNDIPRLTKRVHDACEHLASVMDTLNRQFGENRSWAQATRSLIEEIGYIPYLQANDTEQRAKTRADNVHAFIDGVEEYQKKHPQADLASYLETLALRSGVDEWNQQSDTVSLMTLHCAKGLEFAAVFLIGLEERMLPYIRDVENPDDIEEERRLCYVGITRAKEHCYLFSTARRFTYAKPVMAPPSRFLGEIPESFLKRVDTESGRQPYRSKRFGRHEFEESAVASDTVFSDMISEFAPGDVVFHYDLGKGTILGGTGSGTKRKLIILFDGEDQPRMVFESYAGLSKLDE